jgi:hypothetical protein
VFLLPTGINILRSMSTEKETEISQPTNSAEAKIVFFSLQRFSGSHEKMGEEKTEWRTIAEWCVLK